MKNQALIVMGGVVVLGVGGYFLFKHFESPSTAVQGALNPGATNYPWTAVQAGRQDAGQGASNSNNQPWAQIIPPQPSGLQSTISDISGALGIASAGANLFDSISGGGALGDSTASSDVGGAISDFGSSQDQSSGDPSLGDFSF